MCQGAFYFPLTMGASNGFAFSSLLVLNIKKALFPSKLDTAQK